MRFDLCYINPIVSAQPLLKLSNFQSGAGLGTKVIHYNFGTNTSDYAMSILLQYT